MSETFELRPQIRHARTEPVQPQHAPEPIATRSTPSSDARPHRGSFSEEENEKPRLKKKITWTWDNDLTFKDGRVLIIDYYFHGSSQDRAPEALAHEFEDVDGLRKFYRSADVNDHPAFRLIHIQNATWATRFLLRKFNIDDGHELGQTTFGSLARYSRPRLRAGRPVMDGKTFRVMSDPWRGIQRTGFVLDYLYEETYLGRGRDHSNLGGNKMMELNGYDAMDEPAHKYDVHASRLAVYVQTRGETARDVRSARRVPTEMLGKEKNTHAGESSDTGSLNRPPRLENLDNGDTVIIFDNGATTSGATTGHSLIESRQQLESQWRTIPQSLSPEEIRNDKLLVKKCMLPILLDIYGELASRWEKTLLSCSTHVSILEQKIYENPTDDSRLPEIFTNQNLWRNLENMIRIHIDLIKDMRKNLVDILNDDDVREWNDSTIGEFERLQRIITDELVTPTAAINDLLFRSVAYRDTRVSVALNLSLWRLSWINFIFLPLIFVAGFFGMNVDTFKDNPSIKWYFIVSVCLAFVIVVMWSCISSGQQNNRHTNRAGIYEAMYHELADQDPNHWTRLGPRPGVTPPHRLDRWKWRFLITWFQPDNVIPRQRRSGPNDDNVGLWFRVKMFLARRWASNIKWRETTSSDDLEVGLRSRVNTNAGLRSTRTPSAPLDGPLTFVVSEAGR